MSSISLPSIDNILNGIRHDGSTYVNDISMSIPRAVVSAARLPYYDKTMMFAEIASQASRYPSEELKHTRQQDYQYSACRTIPKDPTTTDYSYSSSLANTGRAVAGAGSVSGAQPASSYVRALPSSRPPSMGAHSSLLQKVSEKAYEKNQESSFLNRRLPVLNPGAPKTAETHLNSTVQQQQPSSRPVLPIKERQYQHGMPLGPQRPTGTHSQRSVVYSSQLTDHTPYSLAGRQLPSNVYPLPSVGQNTVPLSPISPTYTTNMYRYSYPSSYTWSSYAPRSPSNRPLSAPEALYSQPTPSKSVSKPSEDALACQQQHQQQLQSQQGSISITPSSSLSGVESPTPSIDSDADCDSRFTKNFLAIDPSLGNVPDDRRRSHNKPIVVGNKKSVKKTSSLESLGFIPKRSISESSIESDVGRSDDFAFIKLSQKRYSSSSTYSLNPASSSSSSSGKRKPQGRPFTDEMVVSLHLANSVDDIFASYLGVETDQMGHLQTYNVEFVNLKEMLSRGKRRKRDSSVDIKQDEIYHYKGCEKLSGDDHDDDHTQAEMKQQQQPIVVKHGGIYRIDHRHIYDGIKELFNLNNDEFYFVQIIRSSSNQDNFVDRLVCSLPVQKFVTVPLPESRKDEMTCKFLKQNVAHPRYKSNMRLFLVRGRCASHPEWIYTSNMLMNQERRQINAGQMTPAPDGTIIQGPSEFMQWAINRRKERRGRLRKQ